MSVRLSSAYSDDLGGEVVENGHEHDGAEEDERRCAEQVARLLEEERYLASDLATEPAEDRAADEGGDEPAAAHPHGQAVGQRGPGDRHDLEPHRIDEAARNSYPEHKRGREPRNHAAEAAVADLLEHEVQRGAVSDRAFLCFGDRDGDQEKRHADAVVEPALDVQALTHARRDARVGDDRLSQRGIRRGEHDREQDRLDEHELPEQRIRPRGRPPRSLAAVRSRAGEEERRIRGAALRG